MGSKGSKTQKSSTSPPPEVMENYLRITGNAQNVAQTPYTPYGGERVANLTPDQLAAFGYTRDMAGEEQRPVWEVAGDYYNPFQDEVVDATKADLTELFGQQSNALTGNSISKGAWGGDRAGIAQAELNRQQGLVAGKTLGDIRQSGYNTALSTAGADMERMRQARLGNINQLVGTGSMQQSSEQDELNALYEAFQKQQAYPFETTQWEAGIAGGLGPSMGSTTTQTSPGPSGLSQAVGAGTTLLGFAKMFGMLSDEREKEDVTAVGTLKNGQTVYRFRYKGDPTFQIGLLAQEVEEDKPEAVSEHGGRKYVNYEEATKRARGGPIMMPSYVPSGTTPGMTRGAGLSAPQMPAMEKEPSVADRLKDATAMLRDIGGKKKETGVSDMDFFGGPRPKMTMAEALAEPGITGVFPEGGDPTGLGGLYRTGGKVRRYQDGGGAFDPENIPSSGMVSLPEEGGLGPMRMPPSGMVPMPQPRIDVPPPPRAPSRGIDDPRTMLASEDEDELPTGATPAQGGGKDRDNDIALALVAAGLGIMGGESPYAGVNIGRGGLEGIKAFRESRRDASSDKYREAQLEQIKASSRRLTQSAANASRSLKLREDAAAQGNWKFVRGTPDGKGSVWLNTKTGQTETRPIPVESSRRQVQGQLSAGDRKAVREASDKSEAASTVASSLNEALTLNNDAYSGALAGSRGWLMSQIEGEAGGPASSTQKLENIIQQTTLPQLKLIFGGNPTEGERKILLDMAGAAHQAPHVRKDIFERALHLSNRRRQYYRDQAEDIKSGKFYEPGRKPNYRDEGDETPDDDEDED